MARHNRDGVGTDQHGAEYVISYQPDWLRQIKISRTLSGSNRQSTKTLFRNPATYAERSPGSTVRTRVRSKDGKLDFEVTVADKARHVDQIVVTSRAADGKGDITFIIDASLPGKDGLGKAGRHRRRGR
jgi:hypothetical protein